MEKENNNNSPLIITIILLMVALIGACIYIIYDKTKDEGNNKKETQPDTTVKETKVTEISLDEINKKNNDAINAFKQLSDNSDKVLYIYYDEVTDAEINNAGFRGTYDCKNSICYGNRMFSSNNVSITDGDYIIAYDVDTKNVVFSIKNPSTDGVKTYINNTYGIGTNRDTIIGLAIARDDKTYDDQGYNRNLLAYYDLRTNKYVTDFKYTKFGFADIYNYDNNYKRVKEGLYVVATKGAEASDGINIVGDNHQIIDIFDVDTSKVLYHTEADIENDRLIGSVKENSGLFVVVIGKKLDILNSNFEVIIKDIPRTYNGFGDRSGIDPVVLKNGNILVAINTHFEIYSATGKTLKASKTYDYVDMTPSRTFTKGAFIVVKEGNSIKVLDTDENALATFNISDATMDIKRIELLEKDSEFKSESGSTEKGLYIYASDANRNLTIYYYNPDTNETKTEQSEWFLQI